MTHTLIRRAKLALISIVTAVAIVCTAAPANALWRDVWVQEGAKLQMCKRPVKGGHRVYIRVDNRRGKYTYKGTATVQRNGKRYRVVVTALPRRSSVVKSLFVPRRITGVGMALWRGTGGNGDFQAIRPLPRCGIPQ